MIRTPDSLADQPAVEVLELTRTYRIDNTAVTATEVSLRVDAGEFVAIKGHSGSGKTTLMHIYIRSLL